MFYDFKDEHSNESARSRQLAVAGMFLISVLCLALVVSLVWFLSAGRYLSATFCLLGAVALSGAAGRFVPLLIATREP